MRKRDRFNILAVFVLIYTIAISFVSGVPVYASEAADTAVTGTISIASNKSKQEMQPYLDAFNQKFPEVRIDYRYYSDYENDVNAVLESGELTDVLFVPGDITSDKYAEYLEPLGKRDELGKKYQYLEGSKNSNGIIYGIPSSAYVNGIIYNKEVFEKAGITDTPKSIEEFLEDLYMIKERTDAIPFYTNYAAGWTLQAWEQYPFLAMTGDPDYKANGFINELDPFQEGTNHYKVYKLLYDIVSNGLCEPDPQSSDWDKSKEMLNDGDVASMAIGSWALKQVQDAGNNGDNVAYMPFPNEVDGKQYMPIVTDYCYAINKDSENKAAARAYVDFMLDESGYALDHEVLSVVKGDPVLESYGDMNNVICLCDNEASDDNYRKRQILSTNLNILDSTDEIKRVIEAAEGKRDENFDDIANDWNERWGSSRTPDMITSANSREIVLNSSLSENYEIEFSDTEQQYIDSIDVLKVGYLRNMAPFQYESDGKFDGVLKDIIDIVGQSLDIDIEEVGFDNTDEMVKALLNGDINFAAGVEKTAKYSTELKFSTKSLDIMKVMVKSDSKNTNEALKGSMIELKGEDYSGFKTESSKTVEASDLRKGLEQIENLKADFIISDYYSVYYYTQEQGFEHLDITPISGSDSMCFAYTRGCDTRLISVCNKVLYSIPDENKQIMLDENMKTENQHITLKRFIEANPFPSIIVVLSASAIIILFIVIMTRQRSKIARIDALTGLYNRYGIRERMGKIYDKSHFPIVISILDIDNFKSVNDTLGHLGGDEALKLLADTMKQVFGNKVVLGRYGGDEFVIGFHCNDLQDAQKKFEALVLGMDRRFSYEDKSVDLSISVGAVIVEEEVPYDDIFKAADLALYSVKEKGKNNYVIKKYNEIGQE